MKTGVVEEKPPVSEVVAMILQHLDMMIAFKGEYTGVREMRKHLAWYTTGYPGSAGFRRMINSMETMEELLESLDRIFPPVTGED